MSHGLMMEFSMSLNTPDTVKVAHRRISTIEPDLTSHRILVPELSLGERLADQDPAYRGLPLTEVALHERETEHIEKRRVSVRSPGVHDVAVDLVLLQSVSWNMKLTSQSPES